MRASFELGAPGQNRFVESFDGRVPAELLDVELFFCLAEARVLIGDWREDYNHRRPHSALAMKARAVFAAGWGPGPASAQWPGPLRSVLRTSLRGTDREARYVADRTINRLS